MLQSVRGFRPAVHHCFPRLLRPTLAVEGRDRLIFVDAGLDSVSFAVSLDLELMRL